jgi:hypothetical protein
MATTDRVIAITVAHIPYAKEYFQGKSFVEINQIFQKKGKQHTCSVDIAKPSTMSWRNYWLANNHCIVAFNGYWARNVATLDAFQAVPPPRKSPSEMLFAFEINRLLYILESGYSDLTVIFDTSAFNNTLLSILLSRYGYQPLSRKRNGEFQTIVDPYPDKPPEEIPCLDMEKHSLLYDSKSAFHGPCKPLSETRAATNIFNFILKDR